MSGKNIPKVCLVSCLLVFIALNHFLLLGRFMWKLVFGYINHILDESNFLGYFKSSVEIWSGELKDNNLSEIFNEPKNETNKATKEEHDILDIELGR